MIALRIPINPMKVQAVRMEAGAEVGVWNDLETRDGPPDTHVQVSDSTIVLDLSYVQARALQGALSIAIRRVEDECRATNRITYGTCTNELYDVERFSVITQV